MENQLKAIGEVCQLLGASRTTLWAWEHRGIVEPHRDHREHRYCDSAQIKAMRQHLQPKKREA